MAKKILLWFLLILFAVPGLQSTFNIVEVPPLEGVFVADKRPELYLSNWMSGDFQEKFSSFADQQAGFRPFFVRMRNQIHYLLFGESAEEEYCIGYDDNIFGRNNIRSVGGLDFAGVEAITDRCKKLKVIQDSLERWGISLCVVIAPGKANCFPDDIPARYKKAVPSKTNYYWISKELKEKNIHHIDFHKFFLKEKDVSSHLLFTKFGIHWSYYGMILAFDSLTHYLEKSSGNILPGFSWSLSGATTSAQHQDNDMVPGLNLFHISTHEVYTYPKIEFETQTTAKPKVLIIGDSYFRVLIPSSLPENIFDYTYWYYHNTVYRQGKPESPLTEGPEYWETILSHQYVILMSSEVSWGEVGFDFVENMHAYFTNKEYIQYSGIVNEAMKAVTGYANYIRSNRGMMDADREKAREKNISVDQMVLIDAAYLAEQHLLESVTPRPGEDEIRIESENVTGNTILREMAEKRAKKLGVESTLLLRMIAIIRLSQKERPGASK